MTTNKNDPHKNFWQKKHEVEHLSRTEFLYKLKSFGEEFGIPNISWTGVAVLEFFLHLLQPKKVLEIGAANGFSGMIMAKELEKWGGNLLTTEISIPSFHTAQKNFDAASFQNIEIRLGDALQTINENDAPFDMIFIDGQKSWTHKFFAFAETMLSDNGVIVVDDVRKFPDKMQSFWNFLEREKHKWIFFEVKDGDDGILVIRKNRV